VIDERDALLEKVTKLEAFVKAETFAALPVVDRCLLGQQLVFMTSYWEILNERTRRFPV
jgi:hypothetical protein